MTKSITMLGLLGALCVWPLGCNENGPAPKANEVASKADGPLAGQNVLLITLDTTRANRLGCYGYDKAATPTLDRIASSGVLFEQAFSQVPLTLPSHTSIMTGKYPREHGIRDNNQGGLNPNLDTLAKAFHRHAYRTGAFVAAFVLDSHYGLDSGFDVYDDDMVTSKMGVQPAQWQNPGNVVTDRALAWLDTVKDQPFFAWVHYYDAHEPYAPPPPFDSRFDDPYDGEIAFVDTQVKRLTDWLASSGLDKRTLIVVVADHGEGFKSEHGEKGHSVFVYDTNIHVPMIFNDSKLEGSGKRVPAIVELVDVYPTVMDLFGFQRKNKVLSRSLVDALEGKEIEDVASYAESQYGKDAFNWAEQRGLTTARWKYISSTKPELFDRAADPKETRNVLVLHKDVAASMLEALKARYAQMEEGEAAPVEDSPEVTAALKSLGYLHTNNKLVEPSKEFLTPGLADPKDKLFIVEQLKAGMEAVRQGQHTIAINLLSNVKKECPYAAAAYVSLGIAYTHAGQPGLAEETLNELLDKDPKNYAGNVAMGDAQMQLQRPEQAIRYYTIALGNDLPFADLYAKLGMAYRTLGKTDDAIKSFKKALDLLPNFPDAHLQLADTLSAAGDVMGAIDHYRDAIAQRPKYAIAYYNLGLELVKVKRPKEAEEAFRSAIEQRPKYGDAMINLAIVLTQEHKLDEAKEILGKAQDVPDVKCKALYLLGVVEAQDGQVDKTVQHYEQALTCQPFDPSPVTELAAYYLTQKKPSEALRVLRLGAGKAPDNVGILTALAELLSTSPDDSVRDGSEAVEVAQKAADATKHKSPRVLRVLATALAENGKFDNALKVAQQARAMAEQRRMQQVAQQVQRDISQYEKKQPVRASN